MQQFQMTFRLNRLLKTVRNFAHQNQVHKTKDFRFLMSYYLTIQPVDGSFFFDSQNLAVDSSKTIISQKIDQQVYFISRNLLLLFQSSPIIVAIMSPTKKHASKRVPPPPPGLPSLQDHISQIEFAARVHSSHEMRGGNGVPVNNGVVEAQKSSKSKSLFKCKFLSKST